MRRFALASFTFAAALLGPRAALAEGFALPSPQEYFGTVARAARDYVLHPEKRDLRPEDQALVSRSARYLDADPKLVRLAVLEARRQGVEPTLVLALIQQESRFNARAVARPYGRGGGEIGLMQLTPETAHGAGARELLDPRTSLRSGIRRLRALQHRYGDTRKALGAYSPGPSAWGRFYGYPPEEVERIRRQQAWRILDLQRKLERNMEGR